MTQRVMTRLAVLTPQGRGAIAVVVVSGPDALEQIDACFVSAGGKPVSAASPGAIRFGRWRNEGTQDHCGEEVVVVRTEVERVEVHCHGGAAASAAIVASLTGRGAELGQAWELVDTTGRSPLAQQAWRMMAEAPTERVAGLLLDQANGAFERELLGVLASIEEDGVAEAIRSLDTMLKYGPLAGRLIEPWRVVLCGPPNVGKSSLINALVGYERAIVFDQPGTTRDVVTAVTAVGGWPVTLADTAGLHSANDEIEAAGVRLAGETISEADLVVVVQESQDYLSESAVAFRDSIASGAVRDPLWVASKSDLSGEVHATDASVIATSVVNGIGIAQLLEAIETNLAPSFPSAGEGAPFRVEHVSCMRTACGELANGETQLASRRLRALLASPGTGLL